MNIDNATAVSAPTDTDLVPGASEEKIFVERVAIGKSCERRWTTGEIDLGDEIILFERGNRVMRLANDPETLETTLPVSVANFLSNFAERSALEDEEEELKEERTFGADARYITSRGVVQHYGRKRLSIECDRLERVTRVLIGNGSLFPGPIRVSEAVDSIDIEAFGVPLSRYIALHCAGFHGEVSDATVHRNESSLYTSPTPGHSQIWSRFEITNVREERAVLLIKTELLTPWRGRYKTYLSLLDVDKPGASSLWGLSGAEVRGTAALGLPGHPQLSAVGPSGTARLVATAK